MRLYFLLLIFTVLSCKQEETLEVAAPQDDVLQLIEELVSESGTMSDLHQNKSIQYDLHTIDYTSGEEAFSKEYYWFDGEISMGIYPGSRQVPEQSKEVSQLWNGNTLRVWEDEKLIDQHEQSDQIIATRKNNYYWLIAIQKLLDYGAEYQLLSSRNLDGTEYQVIEQLYDTVESESQKKVHLYINPKTNLVDYYLLMEQDVSPLLIHAEYQSVEGINLLSRGWVRKSNLEATMDGTLLYEHHCLNIELGPSDLPIEILSLTD